MSIDSARLPAGARSAEIVASVRDGYEVHQAALRRGMNVVLYPRQVLMVSGAGDEREMSFIHGIPQSSTLGAVTYAQDKRMRRALLERAGLPVPKGASFSVGRGVDEAKAFAQRIGYPVVVKPAMGDNAIETSAGIQNEEQLDAAIDYLRTPPTERSTFVRAAYALTELREPGEENGRVVVPPGYRFLVEKHVQGEYARFLVLRDEVRSVVRCPAPPAGGLDGACREVLEEAHPALQNVAVQAARVLPGLSVAAVDMVVADLRQPADQQQVWIVELSERPGLAVQADVSPGLSQRLGDVIVCQHADERGITLNETRDDVAVTFHAEAIPDLDGAVAVLAEAARELGLTEHLEIKDRVEGVIDGRLEGPPAGIAWLAEALLDGKLDGHRAMLVEERHHVPAAG